MTGRGLVVDTGFRHKIGDALYDLFTPYESNDAPDYVVMYPVVKITERYVYVRGPECFRWRAAETYRFSRAALELEGWAWNQAHRLGLRTRPMPDWPILVLGIREVSPPALPAAG